MAHFAKLDENNIVVAVVVVNNETLDPNNEEQTGVAFLNSLYSANDNWKQTSYNGNFRKLYAGIGYFYDEVNDVFLPPQPFLSWTLDENFNWQAPVSYPLDNKFYIWNEQELNWVENIVSE